MNPTTNQDEFQTYGVDPLDPEAGAGGAAAPMKANKWLQILKKSAQQQPSQQQQGQQQFSPVQTYNTLGNIGGQIAKYFMANGGTAHGPTPAIIGEAGREMLTHDDGSQELIESPQARMLGTNGTDTVTPLTRGPHHPTSAGKSLMHRLKIKHRFGDGGIVDGEYPEYGPDGLPLDPGPRMFHPPPDKVLDQPMPMDVPAEELTSPELPRDPMGGAIAPARGAAMGPVPPSVRDQLAALKQPVREKPSLLRQLAAGAIGGAAGYVNAAGRVRHPIDMTAAENAIKYPGYGQQVQDYTRQKADLTNQLAQQQGGVADQQAQAGLAHTRAQTDLSKKQAENFGYATLGQMVEKGGVIEDAGHPTLTSPEADQSEQAAHRGSHMQVGGKNVYMPTAAEKAEGEARGKKAGWVQITKELADAVPEMGLKEGDSVPPTVARGIQSIVQKKKSNPQLKFEHFTDDNTGDVTTVGFDPTTGKAVSTDTQRGIAKKRPQVISVTNQIANDPENVGAEVEAMLQSPDRFHDIKNAALQQKVSRSWTARTGLPPPVKIDAQTKTMESGSQIALQHVANIKALMADPEIQQRLGPILGRIGNAEQDIGATAGLSPSAAQKAQDLRASLTYLFLREGRALFGGRPPEKLMARLDTTSPKVAETLPMLNGALGAVDRSARSAIISAERQRFGGKTRPGFKPGYEVAPVEAGGGVNVTDPRGTVHTFPNQAAADDFKKKAGIK